jgi:multimeric flavodoxin WrbA
LKHPKVVAIYGSPRRKGNTATLLKEAVRGARESGAAVEEVVLRDLKISPCLEIYGCKQAGECAIKDDFQKIRDLILNARGLILASPIFFYSVSSHTKILMDRFQSLWVKKYWVDKDGSLLSVKYFFDVLDMELWEALLYRKLDFQGDVLKFPEYLLESYEAGKAFVREL